MFSRMSIRKKLLLLVVLGSIGLIWVAGYGMAQLNSLTARSEQDTQVLIANEALLVASSATLSQFKTQVQEWKNILIRGNDQAEHDKYLKQFGEAEARTAASLTLLEKQLGSIGGNTELATKALNEHRALGTKYREALKQYKPEDPTAGKQVDALVKGMDRPLATALAALISHIEKTTKTQAEAQISASARLAHQAGAWMLGASALALLGLILGGVWLSRTIIVAIDEQRLCALGIEQHHDLSLRIPVRGQNELGQCAQAINAMLMQFQTIVRDIREKSLLVNQQTQAIAQAVSQLTHAASGQESASSAVSAATEQLSVSIGQVGDSAAETQQLAAHSLELSARGQRNIEAGNQLLEAIAHSMTKTEHVIEELAQRSDAISSIVQTVKEIANQTNLLALNAAIEAARAGEQGRGFAIVADEVRKLAESTTKSAAEIDTLAVAIQSSATDAIADVRKVVHQFDGQLSQAKETQSLIQAIQEASSQTNDANTRISDTLREQLAGSHLIAEQIGHIADMTNQSARQLAGVDASARSLDALVEDLTQTAARFQV